MRRRFPWRAAAARRCRRDKTARLAGSGEGTLHGHATRIIAQAQKEGDWIREWSADALAHYMVTTYNLMLAELEGSEPDAAAVRLLSLIGNGAQFRGAKSC